MRLDKKKKNFNTFSLAANIIIFVTVWLLWLPFDDIRKK